jgi:hypothetical protein
MLEEFLERLAADKRSRGNPLVPYLAPFAASLVEDGYADATTKLKLWLLCDFGQWPDGTWKTWRMMVSCAEPATGQK